MSSNPVADAISHAFAALTLHRNRGYRAGEGRALNNIGWDQLQLGHFRQAILYRHRSLDLFHELVVEDDDYMYGVGRLRLRVQRVDHAHRRNTTGSAGCAWKG